LITNNSPSLKSSGNGGLTTTGPDACSTVQYSTVQHSANTAHSLQTRNHYTQAQQQHSQ
jgi:hypothetical protein